MNPDYALAAIGLLFAVGCVFLYAFERWHAAWSQEMKETENEDY